MRHARDALLTSGLDAKQSGGHLGGYRETNGLLQKSMMSWGVWALASIEDNRNEGADSQVRVVLRIEGPQTCSSPNAGGVIQLAGGGGFSGEVAEGGLPYAWEDDCLASRETGPWSTTAAVGLANPYMADQSHHATYKIIARYECIDGAYDPDDPERSQCTSTRTAFISGANGASSNIPLGICSAICNGGTIWFGNTYLDLNRDDDKVIATFDGNGKCTSNLPSMVGQPFPDGDCST
jgi:hypothetical protein